ncbi:MAG: diaminopimelate epimerase [bacterium]
MNQAVEFHKISGSGNDFIIIDNTDNSISLSQAQIEKLCSRRTGIGADGLILVNPSDKHDFAMQYFNNDGGEADMCGNGGRSIALYAYMTGIIESKEMIFSSRKGVHRAFIKGSNTVKLQLSDPHSMEFDKEIILDNEKIRGDYLNTGVPHFVILTRDLESIDVKGLGRQVRMHPDFAPEGANVDFVQAEKPARIFMRTYERGVENETLACGTGAVASALSAARFLGIDPPVEIITRSGEILTVDFQFDEHYSEVYLEGRVTPVYRGQVLLNL